MARGWSRLAEETGVDDHGGDVGDAGDGVRAVGRGTSGGSRGGGGERREGVHWFTDVHSEFTVSKVDSQQSGGSHQAGLGQGLGVLY